MSSALLVHPNLWKQPLTLLVDIETPQRVLQLSCETHFQISNPWQVYTPEIDYMHPFEKK